jgi:hypothetical protein
MQPGVYVNKDGLHRPGPDKLITIDETYDASKVASLAIDANYMHRVTVKEGATGSKITVKGANYESNGGLTAALSGRSLAVTTNDPARRNNWILRFDLATLIDNENCYLEISIPKDVKLDTLTADIDAADIELSGFTANEVLVANHYGDIAIDRLTLAGLCKVDSDAGNVSIGLTNKESEVGYDLTVDAGTITAGGNKRQGAGDITLNSPNSANEKAHVTASNHFGDIKLTFGR